MVRRRLRPDEIDLWRRVTALVSPIDQDRRPIAADAAVPSPEPTRPHAAPPSAPPRRVPERIAPPPQVAGRMPPRIDGHLQRGLARGKRRPEATLDLHGMSLTRAHGALNRFILASHVSHRRLVLVITGKGRGDAEDRGWDNDRGILRRQVPVWLSAPPLGSVVLGVTDAHRSHGGSGALYVVLRRN